MTTCLEPDFAYNHGKSPIVRILAILCLLIPQVAYAQPQTSAACQAGGTQPRLHVLASGVRRPAGNVTFTLYGDQRAKFLAHHGSLSVIRVPLAAGEAEACFAVSAPGTYAVAVYHDENDNHHLDRSFLGLPAEGYGFSNNVRPLLGLPSFDSVTFQVGPGETRINIRLIY
jgi:uncharacterized protein (DUF2141 family)